MAAIEIRKITMTYGAVTVLGGVDLDVANGSFFTLLGPSGCGKTTLLRVIAGFVRPQSGHVLFDGADITGVPVHKRNVGMVFQDYALFPDKTVFSNVAYGLRARSVDGGTIAREVRHHLDRVGLGRFEDRRPAELSGGQRQRVALARALVIKPRVLLMDEPLSNLDAKLRVSMRETILDLQKSSRTTTIFVTHDQEEALSMSDRIAILDRGTVAQAGTPSDLYDRPANSYVADFVGAANILTAEFVSGKAPGSVTVRLGGPELQCVDGGVVPGSHGKLIARPEQLTIAHPESGLPARNAIRGRVVKRQFLGARTNYTVAFDDGRALVVEQHAGLRQGAFETGQVVDVTLPADCRAVAV